VIEDAWRAWKTLREDARQPPEPEQFWRRPYAP
jgi:hypothetical protein